MCKQLFKINEKRCFSATALDITVSLFITHSQSGPVAEVFALADANKRLNQLSSWVKFVALLVKKQYHTQDGGLVPTTVTHLTLILCTTALPLVLYCPVIG